MGKLGQLIERHCLENDIEIPIGFYRRTASRYVIVVEEDNRRKLVARNWFKTSDVIHYLESYAVDRLYEIFDFREMKRLKRVGKKLVEDGTLTTGE